MHAIQPQGITQSLIATANPLRCVIVGAGALPVACAELLLERGHQILALVSSDRRTLEWGRSRGIADGRSASELHALTDGRSFDYLLSIVNFQKLPDSMLAAPRRLAINYHDAPLPRYAGSHAATWALLNGESRHAVTWHVMTGRVDAGDILKQVAVAVDPDDTVLTLNLKCHEAAVSGFAELLGAMEADAVIPRRQELSQRTFFPRSRQPTPGCVLPFEASADHLQAMLRALDFGPHPNPIGLPKVAAGESFVLATQLDVLDDRSTTTPGTITGIDEDGLVVSSATQDVVVSGFLTLEGDPLTTSDVVGANRLRVGANLQLESARSARLAALCEAVSRYEPFWNAQLARARPLALPSAASVASTTQPPMHVEVPISAGNHSVIATPGSCRGDDVLAVFLALLARQTGSTLVDVGFDDERLRCDIGELQSFFATCLPLRIAATGECRLAYFMQLVRSRLERVRSRRTYARDLPVRDPVLRTRLACAVPSAWPVVAEMLQRVDDAQSVSLPAGRVLTARIAIDGSACRLLYDPGVLASGIAEQIACQLARLLQELPACAEATLQALALPDVTAGNQSNESSSAPAL